MNAEELQVQGFRAGAVEAGIRYKGRLDLALIVSDRPAVAAGVFTTGKVKAAPVLLDMEHLRQGMAGAILVNSGIANACTGELGVEAASRTAQLAAEALSIDERQVQVCSTGVIGQQLDVARFAAAMPALVADLSAGGLPRVAQAIMTTDTVPKTAVRTVDIDGHAVKLAGLAKGAGMIMPNMATMLCFVLTDASVSREVLQHALSSAAGRTFNAITIDGDTSTNDTVLLLANGLADNRPLDKIDSPQAGRFGAALEELLLDLAWQIVADGEGATKFVTVTVRGAADEAQAEDAARTIANSPLVKTAFFGQDANWGRIIAALGRSKADFDQNRVAIFFDDVLMVENGLGKDKTVEAKATEVLRLKRFTVTVDLGAGEGAFSVYTCDFSLDYVKINADYRS